MKKILLSSVVLLFAIQSMAQVKIGLRFAPMMALTNVDGNAIVFTNKNGITETTEFKASSPGLRFSVGPTVDAYFAENYAFSTGMFFTVKRTGIDISETTITGNRASNSSVINVQYIQLPVSLKLFTNEIADDLKLYFQIGATADLRLAEKVISGGQYLNPYDPANVPRTSSSFNTSILVGAGVQYQMGSTTALFAGITYNRGLLNTVSSQWKISDTKVKDKINLRHDLLGIELGLMF